MNINSSIAGNNSEAYYNTYQTFATQKTGCSGGTGTNTTTCIPEPEPSLRLFSNVEDWQLEQLGLGAIITLGAIFVIGMAGNALVLYVLLLSGRWRSASNVLLLSLTLEDILILVTCVPTTVLQFLHPQWEYSDLSCKILRYSTYSCIFVNIYTLVLVSIIRYLALTKPIRSGPYRTRTRVCVYILVVWACTFIVNIPILITAGTVEFSYKGQMVTMCLELDWDDDIVKAAKSGIIFHGLFFLFSYLLPLLIIFSLSISALRRVRRRSSVVEVRATTGVRSTHAACVLFAIVLTYAFCLLPINLVWLFTYFDNITQKDTFEYLVIKTTAKCLLYFNSCLSPFLYHYMSVRFRQDAHRLFGVHGAEATPTKTATIRWTTTPPESVAEAEEAEEESNHDNQDNLENNLQPPLNAQEAITHSQQNLCRRMVSYSDFVELVEHPDDLQDE